MTHLTKRVTTILAAIVLGTTLFASGANAAVLTTATATVAVLPADTAQTVTVDGNRPVKDDGDQHRRFCLRLNELLTRLVEKGVITREQKERILDAFNCLPRSTDRPASTDRPTTTRPTAAN